MLHGSDGRTRCSDDVLYTVRICPVRNFGTHFQSGDFKMEDQKILHPSYSYSSPLNIQKKPKKGSVEKKAGDISRKYGRGRTQMDATGLVSEVSPHHPQLQPDWIVYLTSLLVQTIATHSRNENQK